MGGGGGGGIIFVHEKGVGQGKSCYTLGVNVEINSGAPCAPKARARGAPYLRKYGNPSM